MQDGSINYPPSYSNLPFNDKAEYSEQHAIFMARLDEKHNEIFDWSLVTKMDPAFIQQTTDTESMNTIMNAFLRSTLSMEDYKVINNPLVFRLLQLLQVTFNYMMSTQDELERSYVKSMNKNIKYQKCLSKAKHCVQKYKRLYNTTRYAEYCPTCHKRFDSAMSLDKHMHNKHKSLAPAWEGIRSGKVTEATVMAENIQGQLDSMRHLIESQTKTIKELQNENRTKPISDPFQTQRQPSVEIPIQKDIFNKDQKPKTAQLIAEPTKQDSNSDYIEEIQMKPKPRTAPIKPSDYDPIPNTCDKESESDKNIEEKVIKTKVTKVQTFVVPPRSSKNIEPASTKSAKMFLSRSKFGPYDPDSINKIQHEIAERVHEESLRVKLEQEKKAKKELKEIYKADMDKTTPMGPKRNNLTALREPTEHFKFTKKEFNLEASSSDASYTSFTVPPEVPDSSSSSSPSEKTVESKSAKKTPPKVDFSSESSSSQSKSKPKPSEKKSSDSKAKKEGKAESGSKKSTPKFNIGSASDFEPDEPKIVTKKSEPASSKGNKASGNGTPSKKSETTSKSKKQNKNISDDYYDYYSDDYYSDYSYTTTYTDKKGPKKANTKAKTNAPKKTESDSKKAKDSSKTEVEPSKIDEKTVSKIEEKKSKPDEKNSRKSETKPSKKEKEEKPKKTIEDGELEFTSSSTTAKPTLESLSFETSSTTKGKSQSKGKTHKQKPTPKEEPKKKPVKKSNSDLFDEYDLGSDFYDRSPSKDKKVVLDQDDVINDILFSD